VPPLGATPPSGSEILDRYPPCLLVYRGTFPWPSVSAPRFIMVSFPIFRTMANTLTGRRFYVTLATFVIGLLWLSTLFTNRGLIP
jgi:hypothetical protein